MRVKLYVKLAAVFLIVTLSTIVLVGGIINIALNNRFKDYVMNNEEIKNQRIIDSLESIYRRQGNWNNVESQLRHLEMMTGRRVEVTNNGRGVFDSKECRPMGMMGEGMMGGGMMRNDRRRRGNNQRQSRFEPNSESESSRTVKLPVKVDSNVVGYAHITPLEHEGLWSKQDMLFRKTINRSIIIAGVIAGLVALVISFFISKRITKPVREMTEVAQAMGEGDLSQRVEVTSKDEIGVLGEQVNQLATKLQKLEILRKKLTADVAHELRTPLTTIQSYIEAFQDGVMSIDEGNLNSIHEEVLRLVGLVSDLQELAIAEGGKPNFKAELINLKKFVQSRINGLSKLFTDKDIDLNLTLPNEDIKLEFDKKALNKIIRNLISNAYKYTNSGGKVSVNLKKQEDKALITVRDTGIGISKEELPYIFERFYRVDESRTRETGGTGIGLAIVKELIESQNGIITVDSELGEGTEFKVWLPIKE
ncbi:sensor histidine kinase [Selenihalanaerobacter shriftii]|uniref:histidine kinase n=1 Tax=Selenihalanaerobacter shriftii TaxID=142842 RepID=A0A1T4JYS5_9FIRM|nr:ATP-binding protein [Selenihalanaerobacter shriftii]SJZ35323.1 Signal transduction histidine kinase [Selenihalanaerobacter shriftii]